MKLKSNFRMKWQEQSLSRKMQMLVSLAFIIIILSVVFDVLTIQFSMLDFRDCLSNNEKIGTLSTALEVESEALKDFVKGDISQEQLEEIISKTDAAVEDLPKDYSVLGDEALGWVFSITNAYNVYSGSRYKFLLYGEHNLSYIREAYILYDMQEYLIAYSHSLMNISTQQLNNFYQQRYPKLILFSGVMLVAASILLAGSIKASRVMRKTVTEPVLKLVGASKRIAANDYYFEDIQVDNKDEIGELVRAFNKMKDATGMYITTLEKNREALDRLHQEEMENKEFENQIERMKLEVLRSQINPHFLFNTLNVISGMASLEDAEVTEKMIKSLSSLFRYNLRTNEKETLLEQEVQVVKDYMYLQKMRFGERIKFELECPKELYNAYVPSFTLQPIVENSIVHGLSAKEEGGTIRVTVEKLGDEKPLLILTIVDTGVGMDAEQLNEVRERLTDRKDIHTGIGVGNIYRRINLMYPEGSFEMDSEKGVGTTTRISIPYMREE